VQTTTDTFRQDLLTVLGPENLAKYDALTISPEDRDLLNAALAKHDGDPVAALGIPLPADVAATVRRVMAQGGAR
jgi:hypothetical protein